MPPLRTKLPALQHHKPSGQARVRLNGQDIYLGPFGTRLARDNYDRVVGEWLAAGRTTPVRGQGSASPVLVELVNAFRKSGTVPDSHTGDYKAVMILLVRLYGRTVADEFGPLALKVVREEMIKAGWKRNTINQRVHMVRRIFRWGVAHQMVQPDTLSRLDALEPLKKGKSQAPESEEVKPVAAEHVEACIKFATPLIATMVRLQMLTGMRAKELCMIRTGDIDTSDKKIWVYRPGSHKTKHLGKLREIPIGPQGIDLLRPYLLQDLDAYVFSPARSDAERRAALAEKRKTKPGQGNSAGTNIKKKPNRVPGQRYITRSYHQAIEYATDRAFPPPAELAKLKGETEPQWRKRLGAKWADLLAFRRSVSWSPHQLRHHFGTRVINEFTAEHAMKSLGHSDMKVTLRYGKLSLEKAKEVVRKIG